jgi:hypothetical protein
MAKLLQAKRKNLLSFGLHRILQTHDIVSVHLFSEKSSRIDTNDSQKSKVFKRSMDRPSTSRKSFSLDKSGVSRREQNVPVKYQRSKDSNVSQPPEQAVGNINSGTNLSRLFQVREELNSKDRRRNLVLGANKKVAKCSSSKKLLTQSMMLNEK